MVLTASWPATLMMRPKVGFGDDINRGLLKRKLAAGSVGLMFVGDSITAYSPSQNISQSCVKRWPINTSGAMGGILGNGNTGWPISIPPPSVAADLALVLGPSSGGLRPGDQFTDGTSGHNILRTTPYTFPTHDPANNFGTTHRVWFYPANAFNVDWDVNQSIKTVLLYRASANGALDHRLVGMQRGSPGQVESGNLQFNQTTNPGVIQTQTLTFSRGSGTNGLEGFQGRRWNADNAGRRCDYLAQSFELATRPTGSIFWAYAGEGGYTTRTHHAAGDSINPGGFGTYTAFYSDDALQKHIQAFNLNTFFIYLGQNMSANENPGGGTPGNYKANIEAIIARYKAACAAVGVSNPTFILVSIYPTSDDNTRTINIASALREIAIADPACEYIDLRKFVVDTYGNYSTWQASFLRDPVHPNTSFSNIIADYLWSRL